MNIISGSCLLRDGYSFKSENNGCSIYMNNIFYGHAPLKSGLFLLNLEDRCRGSVPTAITSTLEPFPTRIVTSSLANLRLICSPCFELQKLATETVSNTQVLLLKEICPRGNNKVIIYFLVVLFICFLVVSSVLFLRFASGCNNLFPKTRPQ